MKKKSFLLSCLIYELNRILYILKIGILLYYYYFINNQVTII